LVMVIALWSISKKLQRVVYAAVVVVMAASSQNGRIPG
jgi:hypothetical protein